MKKVLPWLLFMVLFGLALVGAYLPIPVRAYLDFQVIYHANVGLLHGISLYDHAGQVDMIAELANVPPEQVFVLPFPYPPWYALFTLPLALLPIAVAARLWLELNIALLALSAWLLSDSWPLLKRLGAFLIALFFAPVIGTLFVGQYIFPVLLGLALAVYALHYKRSLLIACAAALLTFKPHLGALASLTLLLYLWLQRDEAFAHHALRSTVAAGVFLFGTGFLADQAWPSNYLHSLTSYSAISGVTSCDLCASLPVALTQAFGGYGIQPAFWVAAFLLVITVGFVVWKRQLILQSPGGMIATSILVTLLVSPYLLNYDFVLLLVPLYLLAGLAKSWHDWLWIALSFFLPWLGLGSLGREGNISLILSSFLVVGLLFQKASSKNA